MSIGRAARVRAAPPSSSELRADVRVPECPVEAEGAAGARIPFAVAQAAGERVYAIDHIRHGVEDVLPADARGDVFPYVVREIDVRGVIGREQLTRVVILVAIGTIVVLLQGLVERA